LYSQVRTKREDLYWHGRVTGELRQVRVKLDLF